ncbi:MAG: Vancomycin B-type resistance protein VanW [Firmicutes bacterium ADurb.Bin419]|nr:MAG: Vancomycin B-type resistance protein VanW [Firmicutes bacterium ADurb.Bin419]
MLKTNYQDKTDNNNIILKYKDTKKEIGFTEIEVKYDLDKAVNEIMDIGRKGNIFSRFNEIGSVKKNGKSLELIYSYNNDKLKTIIDNFNNETIKYVKEADLLIEDSKVTLFSGHSGERIDSEDIYKTIEESIKSCSSIEHEVPILTTPPSSIDIEDIYNKICTDPVDAKAESNGSNLSVIPHTKGRTIDKAELVSIVNEIEKNPDTQKVLPVKFVEPKITTSIYQANLFKHTLSTFSTSFSTVGTNNANRGVNIKLASTKINGKILLPGEVFSFNDVVGPRTAEMGYKVAHAYSNGKVINDIGGGICQVSTTLYNATLKADLETVSRRNHMFTVGYVPYGQDAAVSYGSTDFKFKNNTSMPIKILSNVTSNNRVEFSIIGTNENPNKSIEISNVQISSTPAPVKYINDPSMEEGKTDVIEKGMTGYVIDTYKIVKVNGEVVSKTKIHRSTYNTLTREIKKGTKKVVTPTAAPSASTTTDPQVVVPASGATNNLPVEGTVDSPSATDNSDEDSV